MDDQQVPPTVKQLTIAHAAEKRKNPSDNDQIEYPYNAEYYKNLKYDPNFVNLGEERWKADREEWIEGVGEVEDDWDTLDSFSYDIDHVVTQMRLYKPFSQPIPLGFMAEFLEAIWEENPTF